MIATMATTTETMTLNIANPYHDKFVEQLPLLLKDLDLSAGPLTMGDSAEEPYVQVVAQWWGLVFVLSNKAAQDLAAGGTALAGVAGLIASICAAIPAAQAGGLVLGVITAILGLYTGIYASMNRGNGIYITALWGVVAVPSLWVPTPR
jgi:hypothetical protein